MTPGNVNEKKLQYLERRISALRARERIKDGDWLKICSEVFDDTTLLTIYKLFTDDTFATLDFPISTGKEGNVFCGTKQDGTHVAVKIYRIGNATFNAISKYIVGDLRFKGIMGNRRKLIHAWAQKEYANLQDLYAAGVRVPQPLAFINNILVMEYIGDESMPAPMLKNVRVDDPTDVYRQVLGMAARAYQKAQLVHGDISEYNILMRGPEAVLIDCGQAQRRGQPLAEELLQRDAANIQRYFGKLGVKSDVDKILDYVRGG